MHVADARPTAIAEVRSAVAATRGASIAHVGGKLSELLLLTTLIVSLAHERISTLHLWLYVLALPAELAALKANPVVAPVAL
jgi:hypothetical protein